MAKKVFVTGASGYIGGAVAALLVEKGYEVRGLTRSSDTAVELKKRGIEPVVGELTNTDLLTEQAKKSDIVVDAADSDSQDAVRAFIDALEGSNKIFIHTSGSSIVADEANGAPSDRIFHEDTPFTPTQAKQARVDIDNLVLASAKRGVRAMVICPCMIYGQGGGLNSESQQIPALIRQAMKSGVVRHIGRGENVWSTIHIQDLAKLYLAAIEAPEAGAFFFAESGEVSFRDLAEKIRLGLSIKNPVEAWPIENATQEWGSGMAVYALGSNSRIRGARGRKLGWAPTREGVLDDIQRCCTRIAALAK